jgi:hypothetical protein
MKVNTNKVIKVESRKLATVKIIQLKFYHEKITTDENFMACFNP